ncbi:MAG: hypothetical protein ACFCVG_01350 [Kineosporiaceae bacterium]
MTRDDDERRPEPPESSDQQSAGAGRGRPGREWDAAGIDAAFADIVARLQAGDLDTTGDGRVGGGGPGGENPGTRPGRHARDARDARDAGEGGEEPPAGIGPSRRSSGADPQDEPTRGGQDRHDGGDVDDPPGGDTPSGAAVEDDAPDPPGEPGSDAGPAEAQRRARIEREIDFAVDGPGGGRFVPPEPAPLPRPDAITLLAWIAVIGGPLFLVVGVIVGGLPTWVAGAVVAAVVVGFVLLVSRLPRRDETDPDDDGAVV